MTTIAWDGTTLAADTLVTCNGTRDSFAVKVWRVGRLLVGCSGHRALSQRFRGWVIGGMEGESPYSGEKDGGNGLVIPPTGPLLLWGSNGPCTINASRYALGSGEDFALAAMAAGVDAERAVQIASDYDTCTGGEITVLRREPEPAPILKLPTRPPPTTWVQFLRTNAPEDPPAPAHVESNHVLDPASPPPRSASPGA